MKRFRNLIFLLTGFLVVGVTTSFAYWFFETSTTGEKDAIQDIRADNIFENYASIQQDLDAKKISDTEYEIYIFPSNEYLKIYEEYLANPTINPKPEEFNGYLEPELNDDGTIKTDSEGKVIYDHYNDSIDNNYVHVEHNFDSDQDKAYYTYPADNYVKRIQDKYTVRVHQDNLYALVNGKPQSTKTTLYTLDENSIIMKGADQKSYFSTDVKSKGAHFEFENGEDKYYKKVPGYAILHNDGYTRTAYDIYEFFATHTDTLSSEFDRNYRTYGEPNEPHFRSRVPNGSPLDEEYRNTFPQYNLTWENHPDENKPLYSSDRFGYWDDLTLKEGRFKPIKLTVRNSISPELFDQSHGKIGISAPDGNPDIWFEPEFSGFTYAYFRDGEVVKPLQDPEFKKHLIDQTVYPRDLASSFDMDLVFDISKSLSTYADDNNVIRLFPTFASNKSYYGQTLHRQNIVDDLESLKYGTKDALRLETTVIDNSTNEEEFYKIYPPYVPYQTNYTQYVNGYYQNVRVQYGFANNIPINIKNKKGHKTTSKVQLKMALVNDGNPGEWSGSWPVIIDLDFSKPSIINQLNGPGYYNFYIFVGNSGTAKSNVNPINTIYNNLGDFYNHFPDLYSKKMFVVHDETNRLYADDKQKIPILLLAQKATEPKIYDEIDPSYSYAKTNKIIETKHDAANTAFTLYRPIYKKNSDTNYQRIYLQPNVNTKTNPTTFLFKGVDFTTAQTNTFQMRYGANYNSKIGFTTDPNKMYDNVYMPSDPSKTLPGSSPSEEVKFTRAFGEGGANFFNIKTIKIPETDEVGAPLIDMDVFELKDDSCRGIYDIMFAMNEDLSYHPNGKDVMFDVYVYRHTNIFIKLFDNKLTETELKTDSKTGLSGTFLKHEDVTEANCYWRKRFYIGDSIHSDEISEIEYQGQYYSFVQAFLKIAETKNISKEQVVVVDQITDAPIAWYVPDENGDLVLTYNKTFKVLKNYVFYVSNKDEVAQTEWN